MSLLSKVALRIRERRAHQVFEALRKIPQKSLKQVFPEMGNLHCALRVESALETRLGNIDARDLIMISSLCAHLCPKVIFEFGTFDGRTTLHLALNAPANAWVMTIDLPADDPIRRETTDDTFYTNDVVIGHHFVNTESAGRIEQIFGNSVDFDHAPLRDKVDLVFVDAGHEYKLVKSDGTKALEMVRPGGVILWHDYSYGHPGVYKYLNDLSATLPLVNLLWTSLVCYVKPDKGT